jgi:DNA-binding NarL/FixJ family response regulator
MSSLVGRRVHDAFDAASRVNRHNSSSPQHRSTHGQTRPRPAGRLVLASPHPVVLFGLAQLLAAEPDLKVVARCTDGVETLAAVRRCRPDVLLLDAHLPRKDGLGVVRDLKRARAPTRVVLIVDAMEEDDLEEAFRLGVRGMLLKEMALPMVVQCVRKVLAGQTWIEKRAFNRALDALLRRELGQREMATLLTPRELETTRLAAQGLRIEEMSKRLGVSRGTVKTHLHRVYRKLKVDNRVALTLLAQSRGLV